MLLKAYHYQALFGEKKKRTKQNKNNLVGLLYVGFHEYDFLIKQYFKA